MGIYFQQVVITCCGLLAVFDLTFLYFVSSNIKLKKEINKTKVKENSFEVSNSEFVFIDGKDSE